MAHAIGTGPTLNARLRSLPPASIERLSADLRPFELRLKATLYEPGDYMDHVYFPTAGVISALTVMENAEAVEFATIGNEGIMGFEVLLGSVQAGSRSIVQVDGQAYRMKADCFRAHIAADANVRGVVSEYTAAMLALVAQSAACNRLHAVVARCARWLLMTHDRVEGDEFVMTQEFLATMLGVRRASVSVTAHSLQTAGLIRYRRGRIQILDRVGLETASCECYEVVRRRFAELA